MSTPSLPEPPDLPQPPSLPAYNPAPVVPQNAPSQPAPSLPVAPAASGPATPGAGVASVGEGQGTPPWWPAVQAAYQRNDPTVFDSDEVLDPAGLPDSYSEYLPGESQVAWRIIGFRPDSPYNSVLEFSDGVIPLLYVPLTPDAVVQFKGAMDQVFAAQNGAAEAYPDDELAEGSAEEALGEADREDGEKARFESWKVWREVNVGGLTATVKEPGNSTSWAFMAILVAVFLLLGTLTLIFR